MNPSSLLAELLAISVHLVMVLQLVISSVVKCGLGVELVISGVVSLVLHAQAVISRNR